MIQSGSSVYLTIFFCFVSFTTYLLSYFYSYSLDEFASSSEIYGRSTIIKRLLVLLFLPLTTFQPSSILRARNVHLFYLFVPFFLLQLVHFFFNSVHSSTVFFYQLWLSCAQPLQKKIHSTWLVQSVLDAVFFLFDVRLKIYSHNDLLNMF